MTKSHFLGGTGQTGLPPKQFLPLICLKIFFPPEHLLVSSVNTGTSCKFDVLPTLVYFSFKFYSSQKCYACVRKKSFCLPLSYILSKAKESIIRPDVLNVNMWKWLQRYKECPSIPKKVVMYPIGKQSYSIS